MRHLARISAIGMLGLGLCVAAPVVGKNLVASVANPSDAANAPVSATSKDAQKDASAAPNRASSPSSGGYSWSDKRRRLKHSKASVRLDPQRPLVQAPNFELRPDGSSVVTLQISKTTDVTRSAKGLLFEYHFRDAQVGVPNNMNPLVTAHFNTPLDRVMLRRTDKGVSLVLILREPAQPLHQIRNVASGGALLEITLPRATHGPVGVQASAGARQLVKAAAPPATSASRRRGRHVKAPAGPGPNP